MSQALPAHDALLPHATGGHGAGALLALLVHAFLILALTSAVDWRTRSPEVFSAELWAEVPQTAAPPPAPVPAPPAPPPAEAPAATPPAPPAPEPDIAIEKAERRKAESQRKKAEAEAQAEARRAVLERQQAAAVDRRKREQQAAEARAEDEHLARQREENLRRMMGEAGNTSGRSGTASQDAAPSAAYTGRLVALIRSNLVFTGSVPDNATAEVEVRAGPGGTVIARRLLKSSGHKEWDEAVLRAIDRTATLPRDVDGRVPALLIIAFRPRE
jgi:colicin import membrane protein